MLQNDAPSERRTQATGSLSRPAPGPNEYAFTTVTPLTHAYNNERMAVEWARTCASVRLDRPFLRDWLQPEDSI